ncbi:MAG: type III secretion system stator protein SctL [Thiothrix sp.]|nr:type III secretion system stator protein SctL [Thiothrix sp.]HPQ94360.1 type III secretion system stator protein SctL [Thiolinea sp.]
MDKFVSVRSLETQLQPGQTILKSRDYKQLLGYEELMQKLAQREKQRALELEQAKVGAVRQGFADGMEQASQEQAEALFGYSLRMHQQLQQVEQSMVDLVVDTIREVINGFDSETLVKSAVHNGLELIRNGNKLTVRAHPQMLEAVNEQLREVQQSFNHIEVIGDARLKLDECVLESDVGIVNASVEQQVDVLVKTIRKAFPK